MKFFDIISIAFSNLLGNTLRTMLTILGIGVGIATIVFLVSLGSGIEALSLKRIASIEAVNSISVSAGKVAAPTKAFIEQYQKDARVEKVILVNSVPIQVEISGKKVDGVSSIVPTDFFSLEGLQPEAGDLYPSDAKESAIISTGFVRAFESQSAALIGQTVNFKLFVRTDGSSSVKIIEQPLKILGTINDESTVVVYISPDVLAKTGDLPPNQVKVKVKDRDKVLEVKNEIENSGYSVSSVADTLGQLDRVFQIIKIVLAVFGAIALVVASIGMFNTMTIALLERTRDVGIMKATGANDSSVYLLFLVEAMLISILGGLSGLLIGWGTTEVVNFGINLLARSVGGESVDLFVTPLNFIIMMMSFSVIVGFSTGFLPARRGAKLNPLDALRYE